MDAEEQHSGAFPHLGAEAVELWDRIAGWWDDYLGDEGNRHHREIVAPAQERLLALRGGEAVLDVGCGNGTFARRMAELGVRVVAIDASETFLDRARARSEKHADRIDFRLIDATDAGQLMGLGERRFDAAVAGHSLQNLSILEPVASSLAGLLKPGGRFVFTHSHPCFNSGSTRNVVEEENRDGDLVTVRYVKVSEYIRPAHGQGVGIRGQPASTIYFDRPLGILFQPFFEAGFVLDRLEEPMAYEAGGGSSTFSWSMFDQIPPAIVARMRLIG